MKKQDNFVYIAQTLEYARQNCERAVRFEPDELSQEDVKKLKQMKRKPRINNDGSYTVLV